MAALAQRNIASILLTLGLGAIVAFIAAFAGLVTGFLGWQFGLVLILFLIVGYSFFLPLSWVFWLLLLATFVFSGPIQYFGKIDKIFWLPYLIGLFLTFRVFIQHAFSGSRPHRVVRGQLTNMAIGTSLFVYVAALLGSSLLNASPVYQVILSLKEYFFLWGAGLAMIWGVVRPEVLDRLFRHSHWFLLIQLPAILYQRFVIAPSRLGTSNWDAVVGLMSGSQTGGGASATMALIAIVIMTYQLGAWRAGLCKTSKLLLVLAAGLASIMLAEVKYAVLLIPLAFSLVYAGELFRRPLFGLSYLIFMVGTSFAILFAYQNQFADTQTEGNQSVAGYVSVALERNLGGAEFNMTTGEMSRTGAVQFWWQENTHDGSFDDPFHLLLGHGIGASRIGFVAGEAVLKYRFVIGRSTLVIVLWEGGLLAAVALVLLLWFAARQGFKLARGAPAAESGVVLRTAAIGLILVLAMVPYGSGLMVVAQAQLLAILLIARIVAETAARQKEQIKQGAG
jgi:hypothetical protein